MYKRLLAIGATAIVTGGSLVAGSAAWANDPSASSSAGGDALPEVASLLPTVELERPRADILSDHLDGVDRRVHLTAVATTNASRVEWIACDDHVTFPVDDDELSRCEGRIGEDTDGNDTAARMLPNVGDEAYELFWDIPEALEEDSPNILVLACAGDAIVLTGPDANCGQTLQDGLRFNDASANENPETTSAEIVSICGGDSVDGPSAGPTDPCQAVGDIDPGPGVTEQTVEGARSLFFPFHHGATVPDSGFTVRVKSSGLWFLDLGVAAADATGGYDAEQASINNDCTILHFAPFELECSITAADMPQVDSGVAVFVYSSGAARGLCQRDDAFCIFDSHYAAPVEGPWVESSITIENPFGGRFEGTITSDAYVCKIRTVYLKHVQVLGPSNTVGIDKVKGSDKGHWRIEIKNPARGQYYAEIVETDTCTGGSSQRVVRG